MAMGITTSNHGRVVSEPNIVPLIDVLLVLIIIFMVIAPVAPAGLPAVIPQRTQHSPSPTAIIVQVLEGDRLKINNEDSNWTTLGPRLSVIFAGRADKAAFIQGADDATFTQIARAMDIMRGAGITHIVMITAMAPATKSSVAPSIR